MKLKDLTVSKLNVREFLGEEEDIIELINSIKKNHLISKLILRPTGKDRYEIIAGRRRYYALLKLEGEEYELNENDYVVREDLSDEEAVLLSIDENTQRVSLSPMALNKAALKLNNEFKYEEKKIAKTLGISPARLKKILNLSTDINRMPQTVRDELVKSPDKALINDAHWDHLRKIEKPEVVKDVVDFIMDKGASARELPSLIKSIEKNYQDMDNKPVTDEKSKTNVKEDVVGPIEYMHKGELVLEETDGKLIFKVIGKDEDKEVPVEHYLEYLRNPSKFKCYVNFKLKIKPLDD